MKPHDHGRQKFSAVLTNDMPATADMVAARAKDPSPRVAPYPINLASLILLTCFDVVPDDTNPWNPLIAPHAIVTNRKGIIGGPASMFVTAGAITSGLAIKIDRNISPRPTIS